MRRRFVSCLFFLMCLSFVSSGCAPIQAPSSAEFITGTYLYCLDGDNAVACAKGSNLISADILVFNEDHTGSATSGNKYTSPIIWKQDGKRIFIRYAIKHPLADDQQDIVEITAPGVLDFGSYYMVRRVREAAE